MRDDHQFRSSLLIRRLSLASLLKIFFIAGLGFFTPFCALGLIIAAFSPGNVRLEDEQTMTQFVVMVLSMLVLGPAMFAAFCGIGTWIVMGVKSLFSPTYIEVVRDDRDLALEQSFESPGDGVTTNRRPTLTIMELIRKPVVLILATAAATGVLCYYAFSSRPGHPELRLSIASPDGTRVALVSTDDSSISDMRFVVQSVRIARKDEARAILGRETKRIQGIDGHAVAAIHSCENDDIDVSWTSDTALTIRYSQTRPSWVSFVSDSDGVSISLESVPKASPNAP